MLDQSLDLIAVEAWLRKLQDQLCAQLEALDGSGKFIEDAWDRPEGGGGRTRVLKNGGLFEQAGVNFSKVSGAQLPASASAHRTELAGRRFEAMGVSLVIHPHNPHIPTTHMNVRLFVALADDAAPIWWFGGGFDLTPYYPQIDDVTHWHNQARNICQPFGDEIYGEFKNWCDRYFYLKHRQETRGVGGLFFDDLNRWPFEQSFAFTRAVGEGFIQAYAPIVEQRAAQRYSDRERQFQLYRRGRYVEFNLVHDRGTLFGLQSGGRTESILMSLPPLVRWEYAYQPDAHSAEANLDEFLKPRDWLFE